METRTTEGRGPQLERWALEAGFDRAAVAVLEPSGQGEAYRRWIERGDHAGMAWLGRGGPALERRLDPRQLVPGARSALVVALQYHPLIGEDEPEGDLWPRVARYARGVDYHDLMTDRLRALQERIEAAYPGTAGRSYVDTGPLLERELAARAGLGVQGKNTCLLSRDGGSWFLLGEIVTTLEIDPAEQASAVSDLCGRCTRCLDHCPTGALPEPYRLDANRCISYWTIEHRGDFPEPVREMVGDWVFGCDVCQEVCPWNIRGEVRGEARAADHPELALPAERRELDLVGLLTLRRDEYQERFRGSPMKRTKLEGLRRNAAVALGNRGDRTAVPALERVLMDDDPEGAGSDPARDAESHAMVRRHAAWALERIGGARARRALERCGWLESEGPT